MAFKRSEEYMTKITLEALDRETHLDAVVKFIRLGSKIKAYCEDTKTFLQFPRELRKEGRSMFADVVKAKQNTGKVFFRAYPGSIRHTKDGDSVA